MTESTFAPPSPCPECRHRILVVADIGSDNGTGVPEIGDNSPGINNLGQACGIYNSATLGTLRAFVWLPRAQYGLAAGLHDLNDLADLTGFTFSMAMDLNDNAYVVGINGAPAAMFDDGHAWLWKVSEYTTSGGLPYLDLHTQGSGSDSDSCAYGINNASTAVVVGFADFVCESIIVARGFHRTTSSSSTMTELLPGSQSPLSVAFDIRTVTPVWIVGRDDKRDESEDCEEEEDTLTCYFRRRDPVVWEDFGPDATLLFRPDSDNDGDGGAHVRAINSQGKMVGVYWVQPESGPTCARFAFLWDGLSQTVALAGAMPPEQMGDRCWAEGISDPDAGSRYFVVGFNIDEEHGIIWEQRTDADLCAIDPNETTLPCDTSFVIEKVFDINKHGHAIVHGHVGTQRKVGILTCRADLNADLRVSHSDEAILEDQMENCTSSCSADLDCDDDVDEDDLSILIATASGSALCKIERICDDEESFFGGGMTLQAALEVIGFGSVDDWLACLVGRSVGRGLEQLRADSVLTPESLTKSHC
jgi:hypothetical protein